MRHRQRNLDFSKILIHSSFQFPNALGGSHPLQEYFSSIVNQQNQEYFSQNVRRYHLSFPSLWLQLTFIKEKAGPLHKAALDLKYGEYFSKVNCLEGEKISPRANTRNLFSQGK